MRKQIRVLILIARTLPQALRASSLPDGAYWVLIFKCQVLVEMRYYQHNPNLANRQIFKRTDKQKFIFRKVNAIALIIDSELLDANGHVFIRNPLNDDPVTDD